MISIAFLLSIFLCGITNMLIGFLWYSPLLFGNPWAKMMGLNSKEMSKPEMKQKMGRIYAFAFLAAMVTGAILYFFLAMIGILATSSAIMATFLIWMGFVSTTQFTNWLFSNKPFQLFLIDTGYQLVALSVMSIIVSISFQMRS